MLKVIIAGTRTFNDYSLLSRKCDAFLAKYGNDIEIVSGGAIGADSLGEKYARMRGFRLRRFPADWKSLGRAAGPVRNRKMAEYADACIVFWDGESRGTKNMIEEAISGGLQLRIVKIEGG